jgi:hypothetical protein
MDEKLRLKLDGFRMTYWPREWVGEGFLSFFTPLVATVVATWK